jgi:hypothetical protein
MTHSDILRPLAVVAVVAPLSGCFFLVRHVAEKTMAPAHCVSDDAKVGDTFIEGGTKYEVTKLLGASPYLCRRSPEAMRMGADARAV